MRVGVVDIGTNSTRLLVADVAAGRIRELERRSEVTRLGQGVDATGALAGEAQERVFAVLDEYRAALDGHGCELTTAVLTSAVRDAANGARFAEEVRRRYRLDARTIDGDTEAALTFLGATAERAAERDPGATAERAAERDPGATAERAAEREPGATAETSSGRPGGELVVIDVGGGSTEYVVGEPGRMAFHASTQAGVVRQTERHVRSDPPRHEELEALADEVRAVVRAGVPEDVRARVSRAIGVAGTATSCAAMDLELEPYDPARVEGHVIADGGLELMLARLAEMPLERRREVPGLHPDRAPTIVAGIVILLEALRAFGLTELEASEHDILWGAALSLAADAGAT